MLRCLTPHKTFVVESSTSGPACDLLEVAYRQHPGVAAVVFAELSEHHGADGHIHTDAERVGAADQLEQARPGESLGEQPVLGQHPGVVHADPGLHEPLDVAAEWRVEAEIDDLGRYLRLLLFGEDVQAGKGLRTLGCGLLSEVDEVGGNPPQLQEFFE